MGNLVIEPKFSDIYIRYHHVVFAVALGIVSSREDAEDVTQEVFATAAKKFAEAEPPENPKAWLARVARNCAIDHVRTQKQTVEINDWNERFSVESAQSVVEQRHEVRDLVRNLAKLPQNQRLALLQYEMAGSSYGQIADSMQLTPGGVGDLIKRARVAMRTQRAGDSLECGTAREELASELDRRKRPRAVRLHLLTCSRCRKFDRGLQADRRAIKALIPTLRLILGAEEAQAAVGNGKVSSIKAWFAQPLWIRTTALVSAVFFLLLTLASQLDRQGGNRGGLGGVTAAQVAENGFTKSSVVGFDGVDNEGLGSPKMGAEKGVNHPEDEGAYRPVSATDIKEENGRQKLHRRDKTSPLPGSKRTSFQGQLPSPERSDPQVPETSIQGTGESSQDTGESGSNLGNQTAGSSDQASIGADSQKVVGASTPASSEIADTGGVQPSSESGPITEVTPSGTDTDTSTKTDYGKTNSKSTSSHTSYGKNTY